MKAISIIGATAHGNHGAEAMLAATIGCISSRVPKTRFNIFTYYPEHDRDLLVAQAHSVYTATPMRIAFVQFPGALLLGLLRLVGLGMLERFFPDDVRALAASDLLVDLAGVSFVDGREKFLPFNILTILPAMMFGVPVVKFAQAMGSFRNPVNRLAAKLFLTHCDHVFGRGEQTMEHLRSIAFPADRFSRAADMAFLLEEDHALTNVAAPYTAELVARIVADKHRTGFVLGICPSSVIYKKLGDGYIAQLAKLVAERTQAGDTVMLFPNATRADQPDKFFNNDLPVIAKVLAALPADCSRREIFAVDRDVFAADIKRLVRQCDMVVVSRFHAMVAALADGVPPLVIGWSHKYAEVMDDFGISSDTFAFDMAEAMDLSAVVAATRSRLEELRGGIAARQEHVRALSIKQINYVASRLV